MKKSFQRIVNLGIVFVICVMCIGFFSACTDLTEEEHIERITQRVQARLDDDNLFGFSGATISGVYILYDYNDEPNFFMVEFLQSSGRFGIIVGFIQRNRYYVSESYSSRSHFREAGVLDERKYMGFFSRDGVVLAVRRDGIFICVAEDLPTDLTVSRKPSHRLFRL